MEDDIGNIPRLIGQLFQTVRELSKLYPDRPFTPDGHLVGSIGEVVASYKYGLVLEKCSNEGFDAKTEDGKRVEIKLTGGSSVVVASGPEPPDLLLVLKLDSETGFKEIYNGQFPLELWRSKKISKRQLVNLRLNELSKINPKFLRQKHPLEQLNRMFETARSLNHGESSK